MKRLLQTERKRNIKEAFKANIIFRVINAAYKEQETSMELLGFSPEEIWVNCIYVFDQLLKSQDELEALTQTMWNDIFCELRDEAKDSGREYKIEELDAATSCIVYSVIACMMATDEWKMVCHIEPLMTQIAIHSNLDAIRKPFDDNLNVDFIEYIKKYIGSGKFISDTLDYPQKYVDPINPIGSVTDRSKAKSDVKKRLEFMKGNLPDSDILIMTQSNYNTMIEAVEYLIENNVVKKQDTKIKTNLSVAHLRYTFYLVFKNEGKCIDRSLWLEFLGETFSKMQNNQASLSKHFSDRPSGYDIYLKQKKKK